MRKADWRYPVVLDPYAQECRFPDVSRALEDPNGLLAIGGRLTPDCLLSAYRRGIFPWYEAGQPILWWSPDPRLVLFPERIRIARSLRKRMRHGGFLVSLDRAFEAVMSGCAGARDGADGTWITAEMVEAYCRLHRLGYAHSAEAWHDGELVGGLYGVALGRVFFGESMFFRRSDASKVAFVHLVHTLRERGFTMIDCQMHTGHLERFGAELLPRERFVEYLADCDAGDPPRPWTTQPAAPAGAGAN